MPTPSVLILSSSRGTRRVVLHPCLKLNNFLSFVLTRLKSPLISRDSLTVTAASLQLVRELARGARGFGAERVLADDKRQVTSIFLEAQCTWSAHVYRTINYSDSSNQNFELDLPAPLNDIGSVNNYEHGIKMS
jgi:hypothetical protein